MTVSPANTPANAPSTDASPEGEPQLGWLEGDLLRRLEGAAAASGRSVAAVCEQWLREGLERFEAHARVEDPDGSGRCSLRTGTCSLGPVPLPVQQ